MPPTEGHQRPAPAAALGRFATIALFAIAGCGMPRDPEKTLDRVRGGPLRVGLSVHQPWTDLKGSAAEGDPAGIEPELVEDFAKELHASVVWVRGSETELMTQLENFKLDLVVAGIKDDTLWKDRVGLSRTYAKTADGKHVLAVAPGENGFLLRLDRFLVRREEAIRSRIDAEGSTLKDAREAGS